MKKSKKRWNVRFLLLGVGCLLLIAAFILSFFNGEASAPAMVPLTHKSSLREDKNGAVNVSLPVIGSKRYSAPIKASISSQMIMNIGAPYPPA